VSRAPSVRWSRPASLIFITRRQINCYRSLLTRREKDAIRNAQSHMTSPRRPSLCIRSATFISPVMLSPLPPSLSTQHSCHQATEALRFSLLSRHASRIQEARRATRPERSSLFPPHCDFRLSSAAVRVGKRGYTKGKDLKQYASPKRAVQIVHSLLSSRL
jgi:hypothetical protein